MVYTSQHVNFNVVFENSWVHWTCSYYGKGSVSQRSISSVCKCLQYMAKNTLLSLSDWDHD